MMDNISYFRNFSTSENCSMKRKLYKLKAVLQKTVVERNLQKVSLQWRNKIKIKFLVKVSETINKRCEFSCKKC